MQNPTATITLSNEDWEIILNLLQSHDDRLQRWAAESDSDIYSEFLLFTAAEVKVICDTIQDGMDQ